MVVDTQTDASDMSLFDLVVLDDLEQLDKLADHSDPEIFCRVANNPHTPSDAILRLSRRCGNAKLMYRLLMRPTVSSEVLCELAGHRCIMLHGGEIDRRIHLHIDSILLAHPRTTMEVLRQMAFRFRDTWGLEQFVF